MPKPFLVVVLLATVAATGCSDTGTTPPVRSERAADTTTSTSMPTLVAPTPWEPSPNEIEVELKTAAATTIEALLTYESGGGNVAAAAQRLAAAPADPAIAEKSAPLLNAAASGAAEVLYPQMGGFTGSAASVMAVTRVRTLADGNLRSATRTLDVRLVKQDNTWKAVDLASLGGDPVPRAAALSVVAQAVLDHDRIELPDSARWDIEAGKVDDTVLEILRMLGDDHDVEVAVLSSGHPIEVFGTPHTSNHIPGRAVDIWALDGLIVEQRGATSPLPGLLRKLLERGVTELGAPIDVDGRGGANFTNLVHQDHLHIGYDG